MSSNNKKATNYSSFDTITSSFSTIKPTSVDSLPPGYQTNRQQLDNNNHGTKHTFLWVRSLFLASMTITLVIFFAWWSRVFSSSSHSNSIDVSLIHHTHQSTEIDRNRPNDQNHIDTQIFSDDGGDDVIELDDDCAPCPFTTTACANPSYGPVLGGVDFVATYNLYNATAYDLGLNQTVAPLGNDSITAYWGVSAVNPSMNYTFYFTTEDNRETFLGNPTKYLPKWGSFCAFGIANETCPDHPWSASCLGPYGNRGFWSLYNDDLYFFRAKSAFLLFDEHVTNCISTGTTRWQTWFSEAINDRQYVFNTACFDTNV